MAYNDFDQMAHALASLINQVKEGGELIIVTGEAHCEVYNHADVDTAFTRAFEKGIRPKVATGPVLSVDPENEYGNNLLKYQAQNKADIYRPIRRVLLHYRLAEINGGFSAYAEYPHPPAANPSDREILPVENMELWSKKLRDDFYYRKGKGFYVLTRSADDFLKLRLDEIKKMVSYTSERKLSLTFMDIEQSKVTYSAMAA